MGTEGKERELHVGQSVVLMDSDLRGKITKLGKTVTIELEDGLVIEAAYGEFAVTSQTEISALKKAKAGKKLVLCIALANPSKYELSEAAAEVTVLVDVDALKL